MDIKNNLRTLNKSFFYAYRGIKYCILHERNMRIHLSVMVFVISFAYTFKAEKLELIALFFCIGLVISCEMINTAIETAINLYTPNYNNLAKITKDVSAGAVLVTAIMSVVVGGLIFFDKEKLGESIFYILNNWAVSVYYVILIVVSWIFVFKFPMKIKINNK